MRNGNARYSLISPSVQAPPQAAERERAILRVLIVDDHEALRAGVRSVLESRGIEVCGEAADGQEALAKALQLRPDLVILDITMPVLDGFSAAREIHKRLPGVGILLLSMHESASMVNVAKSSGALGYVAKSEGIARILKAVDAIAQHKTFFPN
ncbi:MAG: DNA-binding response regulator [Candidatus Acidoferrum typicum]|nr:DNA-binding response regulator [Candidatus Acidoferrum typicum]